MPAPLTDDVTDYTVYPSFSKLSIPLASHPDFPDSLSYIPYILAAYPGKQKIKFYILITLHKNSFSCKTTEKPPFSKEALLC